MVTLRLARAGTKKRPVYHLVAADSRKPRDGRFIEKLGYYMPQRKILVVDHERVDHWRSHGATWSPTVKGLVKKSKQTAAETAVADA